MCNNLVVSYKLRLRFNKPGKCNLSAVTEPAIEEVYYLLLLPSLCYKKDRSNEADGSNSLAFLNLMQLRIAPHHPSMILKL